MDWERISRADRLEGEGKVEEALREYQAILGEYSNAEDQPGDNAVVAMGEVRCLLDLKRYAEAEQRFVAVSRMSRSDGSAGLVELFRSQMLLEQ